MTWQHQLISDYRSATHRLVLLDYDGTLVPFTPLPDEAIPGADVISVLQALSKDNTVFVISGRDMSFLEQWLGHLPIGLVAEHGALVKQGGVVQSVDADISWRSGAKTIMTPYTEKCAGSLIEQKQYSVAWHYRNALDVAGEFALGLCDELKQYASGHGLDVLFGNKVVEIRCGSVSKGRAVDRLRKDTSFDFVVAAGDDVTDEDMFRSLPEAHFYTIKVGGAPSTSARYRLENPFRLLQLLKQLV